MSIKAKYVMCNLLDFALTFGGSGAVIVFNYISPDNSVGYKITLGGIILVVALLLTAKTIFEKKYRNTYDTLLQKLAEADSNETKAKISEALNKHKLKNNIYQRLMVLLPFAILYIVTWLGSVSLDNLNGTVGLILLSMGGGSIFNIVKKPLGEKAKLQKIIK